VSQQRTIQTGNVERETPKWLFERLDQEFNFTLDACATPANAKCKAWYGLQLDGSFIDGLTADWRFFSRVWCNPPYARRELAKWLDKGYRATRDGVTTVFLLPVDTSTAWFHDYCHSGALTSVEVRFLRGRLRFDGPAMKGATDGRRPPAPFASMIVIMRPTPSGVLACRL
jgi:phage N-6-adenine-methyltransferase